MNFKKENKIFFFQLKKENKLCERMELENEIDLNEINLVENELKWMVLLQWLND
jgi:hypothetical protein